MHSVLLVKYILERKSERAEIGTALKLFHVKKTTYILDCVQHSFLIGPRFWCFLIGAKLVSIKEGDVEFGRCAVDSTCPVYGDVVGVCVDCNKPSRHSHRGS